MGSGDRESVLAATPVAVVGVLLLAATALDGAFDIRHWAPLALFVLITIAAAAISGRLTLRHDRPSQVALVAIWALSAWIALSALWSESPALAWEGADRAVLYAALVTLGLVFPLRGVTRIGAGLVGGVTAIGIVMLVLIHTDGTGQFLAGRLEEPIGYRNATACLFAFAIFPLIGVAVPRGGNPALRAGALSAAMLLLGLAFLTQSRGILIGLAVGAVVFLAIGPDRVRRAWGAIGLAAGIAIASGPLLTPYDAFDAGAGTVTGADIGDAATALTVLVIATFTLGLFLALLDNGLRWSPAGLARGQAVAAAGLAGVAAVGLVAGLVAIGNPVSYADEKLDEFTEIGETSPSESTRLGSVGGQRYDLWRVAWGEFKDQPLAGGGEGSYRFAYYQDRRTDRNLSDPHGLPFKMLSELGIVGALLLITFVGALGVAIARRARAAAEPERRWVSGLAAAGAVVLAQAMIDWFWLIPAVMGLGLLALALAARPTAIAEADQDPEPARRFGRWRPAAAAVPLIAAVSVAFLFLSDFYVRKAREEVDNNDARLDAARTAERLNPWAVTPLYLEASALESSGDVNGAREALEEADEEEPGNYVTVALLGDLEVRARNYPRARELYGQALELNPRDVGLQELARTGGA